jgi:hypothetical protein
MKINRYLKSMIGAIIGCATAGGWLAVDLLLPDPVGDYLLYPHGCSEYGDWVASCKGIR